MPNTVKISDIAAELGYDAKDIVAKALELDIDVKNVTSKVSEEDAEAIFEYATSNKIPQIILNRRKKAQEKAQKSEKKQN